MIKKRKVFIFFAVFLLLLAGCGKEEVYQPGTYEGSGKGYSPEVDIRISVTIAEDGKIYEIKVLESDETANIGERALDSLVQDALKANGQEIDTVSGATRTTEGFRDALSQALDKSKGSK